MAEKTKESELEILMQEALDDREDYAKQCKEVEKVYSGDYGPLAGTLDVGPRVKTNLLSLNARRAVAMMSPPATVEFITQPVNKQQKEDADASETSKFLADYFFNVRDGRQRVTDGLLSMVLCNTWRVRVGFKPDQRMETIEEQNPSQVSEIAHEAVDIGSDKLNGQPYFINIPWKDYLIQKGFKSPEDAWDNGGFVARRFFPHIDWVKGNKEYKNTRDIKADVVHKGDEPGSENITSNGTDTTSKPSPLSYCALWEIFFGPTQDYPQGRYVVFSKTQKVILYDEEGKCYTGLNIPIFELHMFTAQGDNYYVTPLSYRSLNPLLEHEYFETRILQKNMIAKTVVALRGDAPDTAIAILKSENPIAVWKQDSLANSDGGPPFLAYEILPNIESERMASMTALARFEQLWGFSTTTPKVQGDPIATELVLQNKLYLNEMNDLIVRVNKFAEKIANGLLVISREYMTEAEMIRITRSANLIWKDDNAVTLEGDYIIRIKSKQLFDMTEGEHNKVLQMVGTTLAQLETLPKYANRIDSIDFIKQWIHGLGFSTEKTFSEAQKVSQWYEIAMMLDGVDMIVSPDDDHVEHRGIVDEFRRMHRETTEASDEQTQVTTSTLQKVEDHDAKHAQFMQPVGSGGMNQMSQNNLTNNSRSAGAETIRGDGASGVIGEQFQGSQEA